MTQELCYIPQRAIDPSLCSMCKPSAG